MTTSTVRLVRSSLFFSLAACAENPVRIDVQAGSVALSSALASPVLSADPIPLRAAVVGRSGKPIDGQPLSWMVVPEGMAEVQGDALRCLRTGDATVSATSGGLTETFQVRCRVVAKIQAPTTLALVIGDPATPLEIEALDPQGAVLSDIPVEMRIADPAVAEVVGDTLRGLVVGQTTLTLNAGPKSLELPVTVMSRVRTDTLALDDGHSFAITLQPGRYVVEVHVTAADGSKHGVTVNDAGGGCPAREEAVDHMLTCTVKSPSTVVITNPSAFRMGPAELGNVSVYQVP